MLDGRRFCLGAVGAVRHHQHRHLLLVPSLPGSTVDVVDASPLDTVRQFAEIPCDAPAAWRTDIGRAGAAILGVHSALWLALSCHHSLASAPSIVELQLLVGVR